MKEEKNLLNFKNRILLCLVAGFIALMALGVRVYAAETVASPVGYFEYNGQQVPYYYLQRVERINYSKNGDTVSYQSSIPCYFVFLEVNDINYFCVYSLESFDGAWYFDTSGDIFGSSPEQSTTINGVDAYYTTSTCSYEISYPWCSVSSVSGFTNAFLSYMVSDEFEPYEPEVEIVEKENFCLTGFECDNTINATWTGVSQCPIVDKTDVEVLIQPSYMYIISPDTELMDWEQPGSITVNYNDMSFSKPYEEFMEGCPYAGSCYLTLNFTPQVMIEGRLYKGSTITVSFDASGNISGFDIPTAGLPLTYFDFYLKDFSYLEDSSGLDSVNGNIGRNIKFMWNGPSFGDSIDYITSDVKIEIYTMSTGNLENWDWYTYEPSHSLGIDRDSVQFNLLSLDKELREHRRTILDKENVSHAGVYFRFTPYFKTSEAYCYGRSVYVQLSRNGSVLSCNQSMGDAFSEDNPGFENVVENLEDNSPMGDLLDDIFKPSEESFNVDELTLNFFSLLQGLISSLGQFPSLFATVFSFLPDYYISMLVVGLSGIILLRILGR